MRVAVVLVGLAGCYDPTVTAGALCGPNNTCPAALECRNNRCVEPGGDIDALDVADAAGDAPDDIDAPIDGPPAVCGTGTAGQLEATCVGTFSAQGTFFDVEATATISIVGFETRTQNPGSRTVEIFHRPGTHVGFETDADAWTSLGSVAGFEPASGGACPIPLTAVPIDFCVRLPAGSRHAFYIATLAGTGSFEHDTVTLGTVVASDASVKLLAGRIMQGVGKFTGTVVDDKKWQGRILYRRE